MVYNTSRTMDKAIKPSDSNYSQCFLHLFSAIIGVLYSDTVHYLIKNSKSFRCHFSLSSSYILIMKNLCANFSSLPFAMYIRSKTRLWVLSVIDKFLTK
jgi:hypothetical protein